MKWISVKDRMPGIGEISRCYTCGQTVSMRAVIVHTINGKVIPASVRTEWDGLKGAYPNLRRINERTIFTYCNQGWRLRGVTHWMPLPGPPVEDTK